MLVIKIFIDRSLSCVLAEQPVMNTRSATHMAL